MSTKDPDYCEKQQEEAFRQRLGKLFDCLEELVKKVKGKAMTKPVRLWGVLWRSKNKLAGHREVLLWQNPKRLALFDTRREARDWIEKEFGYLKKRDDLRREPHGWRMPVAVRVKIEKEAQDENE